MISSGEVKKTESNSFNPLKIAVYSSIATMIGDMLMYPLDTIGTRIKAHKTEFLTFRQGYKMIVENEGYRALFKGFSTVVMGSFVPYATYFLAYEYMNKYAIKLTGKLDQEKYKHVNLFIPLITAPLAEVASVATYIPFDTVRTRMQMNTPEFNYKGAMDGFWQIKKTEGVWRLFQASHMYVVQMIIFTGLQFWFYELARFAYLRGRHQNDTNKQLKLSESVVATMGSTMLAGFIVNPLDLLITRYQIIDSTKQKLCFKLLWHELIQYEGKQAIFKGLGARLIQQCVFALFYLPVYDYFKTKYGVVLDS